MPSSPSSPISRSRSVGHRPPPTPCGARGAISFCANSRQSSTRSRSGSVSEKSMPVTVPIGTTTVSGGGAVGERLDDQAPGVDGGRPSSLPSVKRIVSHPARAAALSRASHGRCRRCAGASVDRRLEDQLGLGGVVTHSGLNSTSGVKELLVDREDRGDIVEEQLPLKLRRGHSRSTAPAAEVLSAASSCPTLHRKARSSSTPPPRPGDDAIVDAVLTCASSRSKTTRRRSTRTCQRIVGIPSSGEVVIRRTSAWSR